MIFLFIHSSEMSSPSFTADSDWDLFSTEEDEEEDISIEEMSDITGVSALVPDHLDDCSSDGNETQKSEAQDVKQEGDTSSDEFIKLEDLYDSNTTSTQSTYASETLLESSPSPPPTSSPHIPDYDQLQNLPNEIVERPRFRFFFTSNW